MGLPKNLLTGANYSRFILRTSPPSFGHNCGGEGGIRCDPIYVSLDPCPSCALLEKIFPPLYPDVKQKYFQNQNLCSIFVGICPECKIQQAIFRFLMTAGILFFFEECTRIELYPVSGTLMAQARGYHYTVFSER